MPPFAAEVEVAQVQAFQKLIAPDAKLVPMGSGFVFTEGPTWLNADGGYLVFSDIPANQMYRWTPTGGTTTFRKPSHNANGNTVDQAGRLITCHHGTRNLTRTEADGTITVLAERHESKRLNSPNDVVVKSDGTIYFTDPPYGLKNQREGKELEKNCVFKLNPETRRLTVVAEDFDRPNGLCFSPDETQLFIADTTQNHIRVFDVNPDGLLANGRVFCEVDHPDGMRADSDGRIWSTAKDGLWIFDRDGGLIGKIKVPETPTNLCFGGPDGSTVFITARKSVFKIATLVRGTGR